MVNNVLNVFTDGGARGNPGPSAIGVYITDQNGNQLAGFGKKIGIATNNVAEYKAVLEALSWIIENKERQEKFTKINFFLDSNLVCSQITGQFRVKDVRLKELFFLVRQKEQAVGAPILYKFIPREQNKKADEFVNMALDEDM